jgi:hypothetical protein
VRPYLDCPSYRRSRHLLELGTAPGCAWFSADLPPVSLISTTADIYGHVLPDTHRQAVDGLDTLLGGDIDGDQDEDEDDEQSSGAQDENEDNDHSAA